MILRLMNACRQVESLEVVKERRYCNKKDHRVILMNKNELDVRRTTVARESMDILKLLRKSGIDGDVDFVREVLAVLIEGIMEPRCP